MLLTPLTGAKVHTSNDMKSQKLQRRTSGAVVTCPGCRQAHELPAGVLPQPFAEDEHCAHCSQMLCESAQNHRPVFSLA